MNRRDDLPVYTIQAIVAATVSCTCWLLDYLNINCVACTPLQCIHGAITHYTQCIQYTLQAIVAEAIVAAKIAPTVAATIAPCIRPISPSMRLSEIDSKNLVFLWFV